VVFYSLFSTDKIGFIAMKNGEIIHAPAENLSTKRGKTQPEQHEKRYIESGNH